MLKLAKRVNSLALSEIVQISENASKMRAQGYDILSLSTGEPDFPTPEPVQLAATQAMKDGQTRYTPTAGTSDLRLAVANNAGFPADASEVIISTGAKQVLANLFLATLDKDEEVIVPTPYWSSYRDIISMAGGKTVEVPCGIEDGLKLSAEKLEAAITPSTRWLLLNSPSNPSGAMYNQKELLALAEVLEKYPHVWIASDEIYQHISYKPFISVRIALPKLAERTVVINGVSKAYSMTGWRIGWGIGPAKLIKAMVAVQGQSTSGACSISQAAAYAAITGDQSLLEKRKFIFMKRRDKLLHRINATPLLTCSVPDGAFYLFPSCINALGSQTASGERIESDADFCRYLLKFTGLAVVPGRAFGSPGYFRLSYAYSDAELDDGCNRLEKAMAALKPKEHVL